MILESAKGSPACPKVNIKIMIGETIEKYPIACTPIVRVVMIFATTDSNFAIKLKSKSRIVDFSKYFYLFY